MSFKTEIDMTDISKSFVHASALFRSNSSFEHIALQILKELAHSLNCQWGTYWVVSTEVRGLRPFVTWSEQGLDAPDLERDTKNRTLSLSEGTPGQVWKSKMPVWTLDLNRDMCLPRSLGADKSGLTGGIWFALKTDDYVYAVIELLGCKVSPPSERLIVEIENLGLLLGHLLKRRLARDSNNIKLNTP